MPTYFFFFLKSFEDLAVCRLYQPLIYLSSIGLVVVIELLLKNLLSIVVVRFLELVDLWVKLRFGPFLFLGC